MKLLALIKAVTVLRHRHRTRDAAGRWEATLQDYSTVYDLVRETYEEVSTGATGRDRKLIALVEAHNANEHTRKLKLSLADIAKALDISKTGAYRLVHRATGKGWLDSVGGYLKLGGDTLPDTGGLPKPEVLRARFQASEIPPPPVPVVLTTPPTPGNGRNAERSEVLV
jgi:hypothetical protein